MRETGDAGVRAVVEEVAGRLRDDDAPATADDAAPPPPAAR